MRESQKKSQTLDIYIFDTQGGGTNIFDTQGGGEQTHPHPPTHHE